MTESQQDRVSESQALVLKKYSVFIISKHFLAPTNGPTQEPPCPELA